MSLQSRWNIISTAARMNHGGEQLDVLNDTEITGLIQGIKAFILHQLADNLICNLVPPFVYRWHIYVVDENGHSPATWGSISVANPLLHIALEHPLRISISLLYHALSLLISRLALINFVT